MVGSTLSLVAISLYILLVVSPGFLLAKFADNPEAAIKFSVLAIALPGTISFLTVP